MKRLEFSKMDEVEYLKRRAREEIYKQIHQFGMVIGIIILIIGWLISNLVVFENNFKWLWMLMIIIVSIVLLLVGYFMKRLALSLEIELNVYDKEHRKKIKARTTHKKYVAPQPARRPAANPSPVRQQAPPVIKEEDELEEADDLLDEEDEE